MKRTNLTIPFLLSILALCSTVSATTIHVPADSSTIQGGLNGALEGDTVLVEAIPTKSVYTIIKYIQPGYQVSVANVSIPKEFQLAQNYPNPFNPMTTIQYSLPEAGSVSLIIYNLMGQEITRLVHETQEAGWYEHSWNGLDEKGQPVATGLYLARLESGSFSQTIKMIFLR